MSGASELLIRNGYIIVFVWVLAEQIGLPLPAGALLLGVGALAGSGRMNFAFAFAVSIVAVGLCDAFWYELGQRGGVRVLRWICRISLEPDSCVHQTQVRFERHGEWVLLFAKFVPGLNAVAPPLAGLSRMPVRQFALFDGIGAALWAGGYLGAGYFLSGPLIRAVSHFAYLGRGVLSILLAVLILYIGLKYFNRRRFLRKLRIARITPEELHQRMKSEEKPLIVDLRHSMELNAEPETIPGAIRMDPGELEEAVEAIPRDREIVLFCSCPNEASSAQMALRLRHLGITRIRPLAGGLAGWRDRGFPLQRTDSADSDSASINDDRRLDVKPNPSL
jgi:membrane protein DedA with SNARE-associated domain/rhodanese-related sulfurtransferase